MNFGTEAMCTVVTSGSSGPTTTSSDAVSKCEISSSTVKITLEKAISRVNFYVVLNRVAAYNGGAGTIDGTLSSYSLKNI